MTTARMVPGLGTKLAFGFGSVAYGVKDNGFNYFLLIFYSQVLGVDAALVGLALFIALLFDAISDPLVGYFSDNTHSRLGRRHPYMYGAAIPIALTYFLLWNPPDGLTGNELFPYLLVLAILIRTLITLYEIPASGLVPELSEDYDQRTSIMSFRYFFGWAGGTLIATAALALWLVPTETISTGLLNQEGYGTFGMVASFVIFVSILTAAVGTHRFIPHLRSAPPRSKFTIRRVFGEMFETLFNKSFGALFGAALLGAIATGLAAGLNYYIMGFFWEFTSNQIALLSFSVVGSAFLALFLAPVISRRWGKKHGAIVVGIIAFTVAPMGVVLRLFDLMPANGDPLLFQIILPLTIVDVGLIICAQILLSSMIADLVEESEIRTYRRSEGVFFAAITFIRKSSTGVGVLAASMVLAIAQFPTQLGASAVPEDAIFRLGLLYAPTLFVIWMAMIFCVRFYEIDREGHEENLQALADRTSANVLN